MNKLQAVFDSTTHVAFIATDTQGLITLFNSGAERLLSYSAEDLVGKYSPQIFHKPQEIQDYSIELGENFNCEVDGFEVFKFKPNRGIEEINEWTYVAKNGKELKVLLSVTAIRFDEEIVGYLGAATDITDIKKSEQEIRNLLVLTQDQNERLNNFARIVSHNLKNHSDGILGILELLREQNQELSENKYLNLFEKSAKNLVQTINYLTEEKLLKSKLGLLTLEAVDLEKLITKNVDSLQSDVIHSNFKIENEINSSRWVLGVAAYLDSVILNLLTNAIKYKRDCEQSELRIKSYFEGEYSVFEFIDNGLGIDMDKNGNDIFKLYKTFHDNKDSRGIGLFITKNQIEQMGGKIEVRSQLNEGTTFIIYLLTA